MNATRVLLAQELQEALRRKSLLASAAAFAVLMAGMTAASASAGADAGFGPAIATLINVIMMAVPLVALVLSATSVVRDRERGTMAYIRSLPVRPRDIYAAKCLSVQMTVTIVVLLGFAGAALAMATLHMAVDLLEFAQFAAITWLLAIACGSLGFAISSGCRRTPAALGSAILLWLALVIFADIGLMTSVTAFHLNETSLVVLTLANPVEAFKIAALCALSGSVDVLGPGGRLATDMLGQWLMPVCAAIVAAWSIGALFVARRFQAVIDA